MKKEINPSLSWDISEQCQRERYTKRWKGHQRRIGITGGIASGKSAVGKYLKETKKLPILDADIYAKKILSPGTIVSKKVINHFGKDIIDKNNLEKEAIDRFALGEIVFSNESQRLWLEELIHPKVRIELEKDLKRMKKYSIVAIIIPLLFEADLTSICSEIWVVHCSLKQQFTRLMARDNISKDKALRRINAQMSLETKKKLADMMIDNSKSIKDLEIGIDGLV